MARVSIVRDFERIMLPNARKDLLNRLGNNGIATALSEEEEAEIYARAIWEMLRKEQTARLSNCQAEQLNLSSP